MAARGNTLWKAACAAIDRHKKLAQAIEDARSLASQDLSNLNRLSTIDEAWRLAGAESILNSLATQLHALGVEGVASDACPENYHG